MDLLAGVDVGGTFTDVVVRTDRGRVLAAGKVPTTIDDQSAGIVDGLSSLGIDPSDIGVVVHGTTAATNTLIEGRGARAALLSTAGFTDIIELRNRHRPHMYGLHGEFHPLIPRDRRYPVTERTAADGATVTPVDGDDVAAAVEHARAAGAEAIGVGFLHAYANPSNERTAARLVRELAPDLYVCTSHEINAEVREYERFSTLAANAVLMPTVTRYLERLDRRLRQAGFRGHLLVVQSNGGVASLQEAARLPVNLVLSGPAAGVTAAQAIAAAREVDELLALDMGGTSLDLSVIRRGAPRFRRQTEIRYGVPLRLQMTDITTVGAGGGSIASLDSRGILSVGPESAGSEPGPACYGRGGTKPTVTDANVVLGRLGTDAPLGGGLRLDERLAREAITTHIGEPLGLGPVEAAAAIVEMVANNIVGHIRRCTVEEGFDPRGMSLVSFGGAGGLHAGQVLHQLQLRELVVPALPGVFSAVGCTSSEFKHDYARTLFVPIDDVDAARLTAVVDQHAGEGRTLLADEGVDSDQVRLEVRADMQYRGQTHSVLVPLQYEALDPASVQSAFEREYMRRFGRMLAMSPLLITLRTTVVGQRRGSGGLPTTELPQRHEAPPRRRSVYVDDGWREVDVHVRRALPEGWRAEGPLVIEQDDTTLFVDPGLTLGVDDIGQLIMERSR